MPRRRDAKNTDLPPNLYAHPDGRYVYRRPTDGKQISLGTNRERAKRAAASANRQLMPPEYVLEAALLGRAIGRDDELKLSTVIERFTAEYLPDRELSPKTEPEYRRQLDVIRQGIGDLPAADVPVNVVADFLDRHPANTSNKLRARMVTLFRWGIAKGLCRANPADVTLPKTERVQRQRLDLSGFQAIRAAAESQGLVWFRNALDLALQTLQRREDLTWMRFDDIERGRLLVRQRKVERHTSGKLAIEITPPLAAVIERCRDDIASPFLVHRQPQKLRADHRAMKQHWSQVLPDMLSRTFQALRDELGLCAHLPMGVRPSFHEIRSLGANLYEKAGIDPKGLLGHAQEKTTRIYLDGHKTRYVNVSAGLEL
jgi:enterobacteria phage integrase